MSDECHRKMSAYWTCAKGTYGCVAHKPFDTSSKTNEGKDQRLTIPVKVDENGKLHLPDYLKKKDI